MKNIMSCSILKSENLLVLFLGKHKDAKYEFKMFRFLSKI